MNSIVRSTFPMILAACMLAGCGSASAASASQSAESQKPEINVAVDADLISMDPDLANDGTSMAMIQVCQSGLTQVSADHTADPDLAESWDISSDQLTYTFHLRSGLKWSNGTALTAADFVYAWQRLANPDTGSEYGYILSTMHVKNYDEVAAGTMTPDQLGVSAPDDMTFVVELTQPCPFLLTVLWLSPLMPVNQAYAESKGDQFALSTDTMIYCGPYVMSSWESGNSYSFTKNDSYWDSGNFPDQTMTFRFIQDSQSSLLSYQQGSLDITQLTGEQVESYKSDPGYQSNLVGMSWWIEFNYENQMFQNEDLRRAISSGIDRDTLANSVLKDGSLALTGFIPEQFAYDTDGKDFREDAGSYTLYDPAQAADSYAKAKEANGGQDYTIDLLYDDSESCKAVAENVQAMLQENCPGLTITLDGKPKKTRAQMMFTDHDFQIALTRWGPDYTDPETFLDFYKTDTAGFVYTTWKDDAFNAIMDRAEADDAGDAAKRWADMEEAEKYMMDHAVNVPLYQNSITMLINPKVTGLRSVGTGIEYRHAVKAE